MADSQPPTSPFLVVSELLQLGPVDSCTSLAPEDFYHLLVEFERGMGQAAAHRRQIEGIKLQAMAREG